MKFARCQQWGEGSIREPPAGERKMGEKPKTGLRNVILVWVIGLTLGIGAGAATALLLMPDAQGTLPAGSSLADRLRNGG